MQRIGVILLLCGMGIFMVFSGAGVLAMIFSPEVPLMVKLPILLVSVGVLLIILSSLGKKDKYEEVEK